MGAPKGFRPVNQWHAGNPPPKSPGHPPLSSEAKALRRLTSDAYILAFSKYLTMPIDEIKEVLTDGKSQMLDLYLCKCLVEGAKTGNYSTLNQMLDRIIGTVRQSHDVTTNGMPIINFGEQEKKL